MIRVSTINELSTTRATISGRLALVPTMGNLHDGHLSLIRKALQHADVVMVSIFVNPLQFSAGEDLDTYPRTMDEDLEKLANEGVDFVFTPTEQDLYPHGRAAQTQVLVPELSTQLCGASRPKFFGGIATVVTKLLCLVRPDVAVFGQKDFQQWLVINRLVADLHLPVELILAPIVREKDGLAMSSRNGYLSEQERAIAPTLYQSLQAVKEKIQQGVAVNDAIEQAKVQLPQMFTLDYLECRRSDDLSTECCVDDDLVLLVAAMLGKTRLIDNVIIKGAKAPSFVIGHGQ